VSYRLRYTARWRPRNIFQKSRRRPRSRKSLPRRLIGPLTPTQRPSDRQGGRHTPCAVRPTSVLYHGFRTAIGRCKPHRRNRGRHTECACYAADLAQFLTLKTPAAKRIILHVKHRGKSTRERQGGGSAVSICHVIGCASILTAAKTSRLK
jgi:hypothetical protein